MNTNNIHISDTFYSLAGCSHLALSTTIYSPLLRGLSNSLVRCGCGRRYNFTFDYNLIRCGATRGPARLLRLKALRSFNFFLILLKFFIFLLPH